MKPIDVEQLKQVVEVALRVRAWIETKIFALHTSVFLVALRVRAWIETRIMRARG